MLVYLDGRRDVLISPKRLAAADTDGTGRAGCAVSGTWARPVRLHGYDAVYDGNATYLPAADHA